MFCKRETSEWKEVELTSSVRNTDLGREGMVIKGYGERVRLTGKPSEGEGGVDIWLLRGMILKEERERGGTVQEGGD